MFDLSAYIDILSASNLYMNKEVSEGDKRMKMQLYLSNEKGNLKTTEKLFPQDRYFGDQRSDLTLVKANFPENLLVYVNQASLSSLKNDEEAIYAVNVALAKLLPLINSAADIEKYECEENEVKLLCPVCNTESGRFLGLEKRLAVISIRGDSDEYFLSYGYDIEKSKVLFSTYKMMLPNFFQSTCFKKYKDFLKSDDKGEFSTLFCYLPSTTDRKESLNQQKGNVQLYPITCNFLKFKEFSKTNSDFFCIILSLTMQKNNKQPAKLC